MVFRIVAGIFVRSTTKFGQTLKRALHYTHEKNLKCPPSVALCALLANDTLAADLASTTMRALQAIRKHSVGAKIETVGLADRYLRRFERDPSLLAALAQARTRHMEVLGTYGDKWVRMDEGECITKLQDGMLNFYDPHTVNPYVALAAQGPWLVTAHGSVLFDAGGYGMLGFGHNPPQVLAALAAPHVMANIMTPSFSQKGMDVALREEIGHTRPGGFPYESWVCLNSGSECNSLAMRIADVDSRLMTAADGPHPGRKAVFLSLRGSFHGRTEGPAKVSDSSALAYQRNLKSYRDWKPLHTVSVNDVAELTETWERLDSEGQHVEMMLMEPVMGEGNPGVAVTREFYDAARHLTEKYRSLLLVDSIQAGLRTNGVLSIMDYPEFEDAVPPDFETFSKAINAGQYPISLLMLGPRVPAIYVKGLYGNTMTTNPRALEVTRAVLESFTPELRQNIREQGEYFKDRLRKLQQAHPDAIRDVTGTGLLVACHLHDKFRVVGADSVELCARRYGLGVIHGGANALRYTPYFHIGAEEVDLICELTSDAIEKYRQIHDL